MDRTIGRIIAERNETRFFRQNFLRSHFCEQTTLADILTDPRRLRDALAVTPGAGELAMARIRRIVDEEMRRALATGHATAIVADPVGALRAFSEIWAEAARSYPISGLFHDGFAERSNPILPAAMLTTQPFVYAPVSVPELLKTPEVLSCEMGTALTPSDYADRLAALRAEGTVLPAGSVILLDAPVLTDLAGARGAYDGLSAEAGARQIDILGNYLLADPAIEVVVTSFRKSGFSSGFATADGPLYHYCFGGYVEIRGRDILGLFLAKAQAARAAGVGLADWIAAWRGSSPGATAGDAPRAMATQGGAG